MVTLNDTSGRGPGPVQGVAGSMMVETICCARSCESRLWTSTCQPRPKLRTLCGGIVTGLVSRIVPGAVAGSTSGGAEYQGSGDGLGRYRSGVRSCGGAGRNAASGSGSAAGEDPGAGAGIAAVDGTPTTTQARDTTAAATARAGRRGRRDLMRVRYRAPRTMATGRSAHRLRQTLPIGTGRS